MPFVEPYQVSSKPSTQLFIDIQIHDAGPGVKDPALAAVLLAGTDKR